MSDKRRKHRYGARLQVRYATENESALGMTSNVSEGGIFIRTNKVHPRFTYLKIELTTPDNLTVCFLGHVRWTKRVPPNLVLKGEMGGMGIQISRFLEGSGIYKSFCESLEKKRSTHAEQAANSPVANS